MSDDSQSLEQLQSELSPQTTQIMFLLHTHRNIPTACQSDWPRSATSKLEVLGGKHAVSPLARSEFVAAVAQQQLGRLAGSKIPVRMKSRSNRRLFQLVTERNAPNEHPLVPEANGLAHQYSRAYKAQRHSVPASNHVSVQSRSGLLRKQCPMSLLDSGRERKRKEENKPNGPLLREPQARPIAKRITSIIKYTTNQARL